MASAAVMTSRKGIHNYFELEVYTVEDVFFLFNDDTFHTLRTDKRTLIHLVAKQ